jgi:hypothetical protein
VSRCQYNAHCPYPLVINVLLHVLSVVFWFYSTWFYFLECIIYIYTPSNQISIVEILFETNYMYDFTISGLNI